MKKVNSSVLATTITTLCAINTTHSAVSAESINDALKGSTISGDFRLRYEDVEAGNNDSDGLTLRSKIAVETESFKRFSALIEIEDVRNILGIDDEGSLIPDPETTEMDQAYIKYTGSSYNATLGRQVINLDGQRYVGSVSWRQDKQTFDAFRLQLAPLKDLSINLAYVYQRNRIFAETADAKSKDYLINAAYSTPLGKIVGYGYLLDDKTTDIQSDTFGASISGAVGTHVKFSYIAEYAIQTIDTEDNNYDTDYMFLEGGLSIANITVKLGYEILGSDDGTASFTTPLATLHKFNGWNDIFLGGTANPTAMPNGLEDTYLSIDTVLTGVKLGAVYHEYSANKGSADYGEELGFVATKGFTNGVSLGLKHSNYSANTYSVDTNKTWLWAGYKF